MSFDISDTDDEVTGQHHDLPRSLVERVLIDIEPHVYDRIRTYAEQHGLSIDDAADRLLADPSPLQVALKNVETLSREIYARTVERDVAITVLASLVAYIDRVGGFMTAEDQDTLSAAKALLATQGVLT